MDALSQQSTSQSDRLVIELRQGFQNLATMLGAKQQQPGSKRRHYHDEGLERRLSTALEKHCAKLKEELTIGYASHVENSMIQATSKMTEVKENVSVLVAKLEDLFAEWQKAQAALKNQSEQVYGPLTAAATAVAQSRRLSEVDATVNKQPPVAPLHFDKMNFFSLESQENNNNNNNNDNNSPQSIISPWSSGGAEMSKRPPPLYST